MQAKLLLAFACCAVIGLPHEVPAQEFPSRPMTLVCPFAAGGPTDQIARMMGQHLDKQFKTAVIVINRLGADSIDAANILTKATPDGHTLMIATNTTLAVNPARHKKLSYDPVRDFAPVALIGAAPLVLVVNKSLPVLSLADLIRLAKSKPGELAFASTAEGSASHVGAALLADATGMQLRHVSYRGTRLAFDALIAGEVSLMLVEHRDARTYVAHEAVRALAVSSKARMEIAPDIPTLAEAGAYGFELAAWWMVVVPAGTPREAVQLLEVAVKKAVATRDLQEKLIVQGYFPVNSPPPEQLEGFVKAEIVRWGEAVRAAGAVVD